MHSIEVGGTYVLAPMLIDRSLNAKEGNRECGEVGTAVGAVVRALRWEQMMRGGRDSVGAIERARRWEQRMW